MKQILVFILLIIAFPSYAQKQRGYWDYKNGEQVTIDGVTYIIEFKHDKTILEMLDSYLVSIRRIDEPEEQFDKFGEYPDGTFGDDPEECAGIIRRRQEIPLIIHSAWKKAFPKEERESHPEVLIWAFPILDLQGKIVALSFLAPVSREYAVQPEQIAILDRELRATLQFEINEERAKKFVRIPGQIIIPFKVLAKLPDATFKPNAEPMLYPEQSIGGKNPKP